MRSPVENIPDWVPEQVRLYVRWIEKTEEPPRRREAARRLATDPSMRYVWRELRGASDSDLWLFLDCAARFPSGLLTENDRDELVATFSTAARLCRWKEFCPEGRPELAAALALVAEHFETEAEKALRSKAFFAKHHGEDDESRVYVSMLGSVTKRLFGATKYRTVARAATVALQQPVSAGQVRLWCAASPLQV
jgi:hypothetical protein